jgi:hypothetical protein
MTIARSRRGRCKRRSRDRTKLPRCRYGKRLQAAASTDWHRSVPHHFALAQLLRRQRCQGRRLPSCACAPAWGGDPATAVAQPRSIRSAGAPGSTFVSGQMLLRRIFLGRSRKLRLESARRKLIGRNRVRRRLRSEGIPLERHPRSVGLGNLTARATAPEDEVGRVRIARPVAHRDSVSASVSASTR